MDSRPGGGRGRHNKHTKAFVVVVFVMGCGRKVVNNTFSEWYMDCGYQNPDSTAEPWFGFLSRPVALAGFLQQQQQQHTTSAYSYMYLLPSHRRN